MRTKNVFVKLNSRVFWLELFLILRPNASWPNVYQPTTYLFIFTAKKIKDSLGSFLPSLPGVIDSQATPEDSLRGLIEKPPGILKQLKKFFITMVENEF